jgi:diketogulonate reductase-like aldo/keto reductase
MDATIENGIALSDGRKIPRIGFGTFDIPAGDETRESVLSAIEAGYRMIDCARLYGNERSVGEALAQTPVARDELFITSKVWNDRQIAGPDAVRQSVEETLDALGIETLDLLLIHWPVEGKFRDTWKQFQQFKAEGLTRSIGVSNFLGTHLEALAEDGDEMPVINQLEFHPYMQDASTLQACREANIVIEAWSPLARGACLDNPVIKEIAAAHNMDVGQVILAWEMSKNIVPIPRSTKPKRIKSNLDSLNINLTPEEIQSIDALNKNEYVCPGVNPMEFGSILNGVESPHD